MSTSNPEEPGFEHDVDELPEEQDTNPLTLEDDPLPEDQSGSSNDGDLIEGQDDAAERRT